MYYKASRRVPKSSDCSIAEKMPRPSRDKCKQSRRLFRTFLQVFLSWSYVFIRADLWRAQVEAVMSVRVEANVRYSLKCGMFFIELFKENVTAIQHDINQGRQEMAVYLSSSRPIPSIDASPSKHSRISEVSKLSQ
jgi:hypothetical protein